MLLCELMGSAQGPAQPLPPPLYSQRTLIWPGGNIPDSAI